ncbi:integrase [Vibrio astriarenae]|nr:integrase [Vibrio sp. C7]
MSKQINQASFSCTPIITQETPFQSISRNFNVLTNELVNQACCPPELNTLRIHDGQGLSLNVSHTGYKAYRLRIKGLNGKESLLTLGSTEFLTLDCARIWATKIIVQRKEGKEPKHVLKQLREGNASNVTVARLVEKYLEEKRATWRDSTYRGEQQRAVQHIYNSSFGDISINELTPKHLREWAVEMDSKGYKVQHKKVIELIKRAFYLAAIEYDVDELNVSKIYHFLKKHKTESHASIEFEEIPSVNAVIARSACSLQQKLLWDFLFLTLQRAQEATQNTWDNVNWEEETLTIPKELAKNGLENVIPLSPQAIRVLKLAKIVSKGSRYIFPSPQKNLNKPINKNSIGKLLRDNGFLGVMTAHGTRSTFSTTMHEKLRPEGSLIIEMVLSHIDKDRIREIYNRTGFITQRREVLIQWGRMYEDITRCCSCVDMVEQVLIELKLLQLQHPDNELFNKILK